DGAELHDDLGLDARRRDARIDVGAHGRTGLEQDERCPGEVAPLEALAAAERMARGDDEPEFVVDPGLDFEVRIFARDREGHDAEVELAGEYRVDDAGARLLAQVEADPGVLLVEAAEDRWE